MASGVIRADLNGFMARHRKFRSMVLDEAEMALTHTRQQLVTTMVDALGQVDPIKGGAPRSIASDYAKVWDRLTWKWINRKEEHRYRLEIGTALGSMDPGLKAYLIRVSMMGADEVLKERGRFEVSETIEWKRPRSFAVKDQVAQDPIAKLFFMEFGYTARGGKVVAPRPFVYPALRWYQARAHAGDGLILRPYERALKLAIRSFYGS